MVRSWRLWAHLSDPELRLDQRRSNARRWIDNNWLEQDVQHERAAVGNRHFGGTS